MSLPQALAVPSIPGRPSLRFKVKSNPYKKVRRGDLGDYFIPLLLYTFISFLTVLEYEK